MMQPALFVVDKRCSSCGEVKALAEFRAGKGKCRTCEAARQREYYKANAERRLGYNREYRKANAEQIAAQKRQYRKDNAERRREYDREYRKANAERFREWYREYYKSNAERIAVWGREYRKANAEQIAARQYEYYKTNAERLAARAREYYRVNPERGRSHARKWRNDNPHRARALGYRRRARERDAAGVLTAAALAARWAMFGGCCWMCGQPATTTDHVIPLSRGGTNWPANLRPACKSCNSAKGAKDWRAFVAVSAFTAAEP